MKHLAWLSRKRVFVLADPLDDVLLQIKAVLKTNGRFVFIENSRGNVILHSLREFRHRKLSARGFHYFSDRHIDKVAEIFVSEKLPKNLAPTNMRLICGRKGTITLGPSNLVLG